MTTVLTIQPKDKNGNQRWELAEGATLHDVTHLACRSARYTPATGNDACSPENVRTRNFPVTPDAAMPTVNGCRKQDYAVLIVVGLLAAPVAPAADDSLNVKVGDKIPDVPLSAAQIDKVKKDAKT
ncbi:MAG: hypothetical protein ABL966_09690, partial [Acidimicrobiales bacterium]